MYTGLGFLVCVCVCIQDSFAILVSVYNNGCLIWGEPQTKVLAYMGFCQEGGSMDPNDAWGL